MVLGASGLQWQVPPWHLEPPAMGDATVLGALGSDARTTAMSSRVFGAALVAGRAEVTVRGEDVGQFSGTVRVPGASRCRLHLGFWCLQLPAPSMLLPWLCSPHEAQSTNLHTCRCVDLSGILVYCAEDPRLGFGCPTGCNVKGRGKGNYANVALYFFHWLSLCL